MSHHMIHISHIYKDSDTRELDYMYDVAYVY